MIRHILSIVKRPHRSDLLTVAVFPVLLDVFQAKAFG